MPPSHDLIHVLQAMADQCPNPATRRSHLRAVEALEEFIAEPLPFDGFNAEMAGDLASHLHDTGRSDTYTFLLLSSLRALYNRAVRTLGLPDAAPFASLGSVKPKGEKPRQERSPVCIPPKTLIADDSPKWFAIKAFRAGCLRLIDLIRRDERLDTVETYTPLQDKIRIIRGRRVTVRDIPVIRSLLLVRTSPALLNPILSAIRGNGLIYSSTDPDGRRRPQAIPEEQIINFRAVASSGQEGLEYFPAERIPSLSIGDNVEITQGIFKGLSGRVCSREDGLRLAVEIEGLCLVLTPVIPAPFLRRL